MPELTQQQCMALKQGEAIRLEAPEFGEDVVVLSVTQFESLRELAEDDQEQRSVLRYSMGQAAKVANENPY